MMRKRRIIHHRKISPFFQRFQCKVVTIEIVAFQCKKECSRYYLPTICGNSFAFFEMLINNFCIGLHVKMMIFLKRKNPPFLTAGPKKNLLSLTCPGWSRLPWSWHNGSQSRRTIHSGRDSVWFRGSCRRRCRASYHLYKPLHGQ